MIYQYFIAAVMLTVLQVRGQEDPSMCTETVTVNPSQGFFCRIIGFFCKSRRILTQRVKCKDGSEIDCTQTTVTFHQHLYDNTKAWQCDHSVKEPTLITCSTDGSLIWNNGTNTCEPSGVLVCANAVNEVYANPTQSRSYFECRDGSRILWWCPQGYRFQKGAGMNPLAPHCTV